MDTEGPILQFKYSSFLETITNSLSVFFVSRAVVLPTNKISKEKNEAKNECARGIMLVWSRW